KRFGLVVAVLPPASSSAAAQSRQNRTRSTLAQPVCATEELRLGSANFQKELLDAIVASGADVFGQPATVSPITGGVLIKTASAGLCPTDFSAPPLLAIEVPGISPSALPQGTSFQVSITLSG